MRLSNRAKNFGCSDLYTNVCGQCFTDKLECNCLLSTCCTSSFPGSSPANRIGGVWERSRLYSLVPRILPSKPYRSSLGMRLYSLVPRLLPSKPYRSGLGTRLYSCTASFPGYSYRPLSWHFCCHGFQTKKAGQSDQT